MIFHVRTFTHDWTSVRFGLVPDILPDGVFRHGTDCLHIVRVVPQLSLPQLLPQIRIRLEQLSASNSFQILHNICYRHLRRSRYKAVYMIHLPSFEKMYSKAFIPCNLLYRIFQELFFLRGDDLAAVLHAPYHMVVNITHTSPVSSNICFHTSSISCQTCVLQTFVLVSR